MNGIAGRVVSACYALMAAATVMGTAVGFWLSYAGLHSFAARAGLSGPEAWAWPASVDLFILAGELGITISTLRDGHPDWRAWGYFAAGAAPSVMFNVLHVAVRAPGWGRYAVAAAPPAAAVLALAALMQQVISLPAALAHLHGRTDTSDAVPAPVPTGSQNAAEIALRATLAAGNPLSGRQIETRFGLSRGDATRVRELVLASANGHHLREADGDGDGS